LTNYDRRVSLDFDRGSHLTEELKVDLVPLWRTRSSGCAVIGDETLSTITQKQILVPVNDVVTGYVYDIQDNLTRVTDPNGNATTYGFDDFGRMRRRGSPVTGTTANTYDEAGNVLTSVDGNGAMTTRTYDLANRVLTATSSRIFLPTESVVRTYDSATAGAYGLGRVATMTDP